MSDCPACNARMIGYGPPDRGCDKHWAEDHPHSVRIKLEVEIAEINAELINELFAGSSTQ